MRGDEPVPPKPASIHLRVPHMRGDEPRLFDLLFPSRWVFYMRGDEPDCAILCPKCCIVFPHAGG